MRNYGLIWMLAGFAVVGVIYALIALGIIK